MLRPQTITRALTPQDNIMDDEGLAGFSSRSFPCVRTHRKRQASSITSFYLFAVLISCFRFLSLATGQSTSLNNIGQDVNISELINKARSSSGHAEADLWQQVIEIDQKNGEANFRLGIYLTMGEGGRGNKEAIERGMRHLERVLDGYPMINEPSPLDPNTPQRFALANFVGRYRLDRDEYVPAIKYMVMSLNEKPDDVCTQSMVACSLDVFPRSVRAADESLKLYHERMDALIKRAEATGENRHEYFLDIDPDILQMVPVLETDPYAHCVESLFYHSFYYKDISPASSASKYFQVASSMFPELLYVSPFVTKKKLAVQRAMGASFQTNDINNITGNFKTPVKRKLRLGVASGFMTVGSSVSADFCGVLSRLDRDIFDITYIYFAEKWDMPDKFVLDERDRHMIIKKDEKSAGGPATRHAWLQRAHEQVARLDLDILYFLETTMSSHGHRFAMARLAPVQAVSHGHPLTSGIPRDIMDYYISWAGAELDYEVAQTHYTEELKLLPADKLHQYYENRITKDGRSVQDNMPFRHLVADGRDKFFTSQIPADGNWYLCMQKPFKLHPEFDTLVSGILLKDPMARILLHEEARESNRKIFFQRLQNAGCDMDRIYFVPVQPHHRLLALYELSDVVLDSYPAGGCTTTREVFELGKPVITWPAKYLGSRWSLAYYNILGDGELNKAVIASSEEEYIALAVRLGTDRIAREDAESRVRKNVHKLFRRKEAIEEWTKMFLEIAPVELIKN